MLAFLSLLRWLYIRVSFDWSRGRRRGFFLFCFFCIGMIFILWNHTIDFISFQLIVPNDCVLGFIIFFLFFLRNLTLYFFYSLINVSHQIYPLIIFRFVALKLLWRCLTFYSVHQLNSPQFSILLMLVCIREVY